jgi:muramoyltetrapeptide carboxypeptidase
MSLITSLIESKKKLGIVAPAKHVDERVLWEFQEKMADRGVSIVVGDNRKSRHGYLAGGDKERAEAFMNVWTNNDVGMIWCYTGGYGSTRMIPYLDFQVIKENPKIFLGMSDITALHLAIQKETGHTTYLGPNTFSYTKGASTLDLPLQVNVPDGKALIDGKGRGGLTGGNLALISALMGTPWEIETEGRVLLLEDVNEEPYKIDRMLSQLKNSGKLKNLAGLILASFEGCVAANPHASLSLDEIFMDYFSKASYPVLMNFPSGHIPNQVTLPLGEIVELNTNTKRLKILS